MQSNAYWHSRIEFVRIKLHKQLEFFPFRIPCSSYYVYCIKLFWLNDITCIYWYLWMDCRATKLHCLNRFNNKSNSWCIYTTQYGSKFSKLIFHQFWAVKWKKYWKKKNILSDWIFSALHLLLWLDYILSAVIEVCLYVVYVCGIGICNDVRIILVYWNEKIQTQRNC